ncbi:GNAT family N-acetyltransferase [Paraburkholderia pallida]|uniref:GNAT family N-acetyltransferase n=2 Tax=Paraburkholderia pallida TaxID=2547399 RepID=A0A4P7D6A9_9BURK|nr:GNAT family N-acetyltransferase [Paraburkholderia pallida]
MPRFEIRSVTADDYVGWRQLWDMYCSFYHVNLDPHVTAQTWRRINELTIPIHGLLAQSVGGELLGLCHYVCHPNTWSDRTVCYLEDVFVAPVARRMGVATSFIEKLKSIGVAENWTRIYWITNGDNMAAQATYDRVAKRSGHVRYEISLDD